MLARRGRLKRNITMTTQDLKIETWRIERLIPYARNARLHSDAQVAQIAASIVEFRFSVCLALAASRSDS